MCSKILQIGLRVLNAYTNHTRPFEADEAYLRKMTGDDSTPGDELACQIIQTELRKARSQKEAPQPNAECKMQQHTGAA